MDDNIKKAVELIKQSKKIIIYAGAGIGIDSGLPAFRTPNGFWKEYPFLKNKNYDFEKIANPISFEEDPYLAWQFYGHRFNMYKKTKPHKGFKILKKWVKNKDYFVFTTNVDGHFQKSGFNPSSIFEVHGTINRIQCQIPSYINNCESIEISKLVQNKNFEIENLPLCSCGKIARPNILMFNDAFFCHKHSRKQEEKYDEFIDKDLEDCLLIDIGSGMDIPTIASEVNGMLQDCLGVIQINPDPKFYWSSAKKPKIDLKGGSLEILLKLDEVLNEK